MRNILPNDDAYKFIYSNTLIKSISYALPVLNHQFLKCQQCLFSDCFILTISCLLHNKLLDLQSLNNAKYKI